jgi:hypothetical protein
MTSGKCSSRLLKNPPRSFRDAAISAFTRVFDALWRRARNPEKQEIPRFWIPGSRLRRDPE